MEILAQKQQESPLFPFRT